MRKMGLVYDPVFLEHNTGNHPENAMRLKYILEALEDYGIRDKMLEIPPREASVEELARFHKPEYIEKIRRFAEKGGGHLDGDTAVSTMSYDAAVRAAGAVITAIDQVMDGHADSSFALVRPPGHHALSARGMGFCLFNNVVIGALHAREQHGLERILVVDWDVHHGNGTAEAFFSDPGVLYFSTHQQGNFPGTGWVSEFGAGPGEGYTVNVPMHVGTGDSGFYYVFTRLLEPLVRQYRPQLIIVSAGFDAHHSDPLGGLSLTTPGFARMADIVNRVAGEVCDGRVVLALEGGYNLGAIGHAVAAVINVFGEYGIKVDDPASPPPFFERPMMRVSIDEAINRQKKYWKL